MASFVPSFTPVKLASLNVSVIFVLKSPVIKSVNALNVSGRDFGDSPDNNFSILLNKVFVVLSSLVINPSNDSGVYAPAMASVTVACAAVNFSD